MTPRLLQEHPLDHRDPRTYQTLPQREGLPGHHGFGREEVLFLRVMHHLKQRIELRATREGRSINDVVGDVLAREFLGPLPDEAAFIEPPTPELTPEAAVVDLDPMIQEAYTTGLLVEEVSAAPLPALEEPPQYASSNLWTDLVPALTAVIGEDNFEIWLSPVRFLGAADTIRLSCPSDFFLEYLTSHQYLEVIEDELQKTGETRPVVFEVASPAPSVETTTSNTPKANPRLTLLALLANVTTLDQLEAFETRTYPKIYRARMLEAMQVVTRHQGSALTGIRKVGFNEAHMAEEIAVLKTQRLEEEAKRALFRKERRAIFKAAASFENLRQKGNPRTHRQYAAPSHFDTDGRPDRGLVNDAARALKGNLKN